MRNVSFSHAIMHGPNKIIVRPDVVIALGTHDARLLLDGYLDVYVCDL